jgi:hypothetical protein
MTPHGKPNHNTHIQNSPQYTQLELKGDGTTTTGNAVALFEGATEHSIPQCQKPSASPEACHQPQRAARADCEAYAQQPSAIKSRVIVSRHLTVQGCVRSASWANQSREGGCRQISGRTNLSAKISAARIGEFLSAISQGSHHPARPNTTLRSEPAKTRDRRAAGFAAMLPRRLPSMPSWLTSSRGSNDRAYPGHRRAI